MKTKIAHVSIISALVSGLLACGGGGSSTGISSGNQITGIGGTGITSSGTITGFGSIFVNGVEFDTNNASILVDDSNQSESSLRIGMVVKVKGTVNDDHITGDAELVTYDGDLEGPIANAPTANADNTEIRFTVLRTTVVINAADTVLEGTNFDDIIPAGNLNVGDMIDASGFYNVNGELVASYLKKKSDSFTANITEVEAKGTISNLSGSNFTLTIASGASLSVNAAAANLSDIPNGTLANGQFVEVKGTLSAANSPNLNATEIEYEDFDSDEDNVSIEGIVTDYNSLSDFKVAGRPIDASSATFEPATLVLANGMEVEVEGAIINGTLIASEVESRGGEIEIHATVSSTTNNSITLSLGDGTLTVTVDNQTRMEDDVSDLSPFNVSDINPGDFLEIEAYEDGNNQLIASRIKRDSTGDTILQGFVESFTNTGGGAGSVTILGVTFSTTIATDFEDTNDVNITPKQDFFISGVGGSPVDDLLKIVDSDPADGTADEVEFED